MCGGDANPAALPLAGWQAVDAIQQVEDQRIQAWREDNGLNLDEDFAFAFTTYEQAGLVADRWVAVCCDLMEGVGGVASIWDESCRRLAHSGR